MVSFIGLPVIGFYFALKRMEAKKIMMLKV